MDDMKRCEYCDVLVTAQHHPACVELGGSLELWKSGWNYGFADNQIPHYAKLPANATWYLGYLLGKHEINNLIDDAAQERVW